jgi:hypothetical protein
MALGAYYLTGAVTRSQLLPVRTGYGVGQSFERWDACLPQIVFGRSLVDAEKQFEGWLQSSPEGESPRETIIRKITTTPFADKFLAESGSSAWDWPKIVQQVESQLGSVSVDDFEQGYWVNVDEVVRPDKLSFSAGTLQSEVPEDIRSGLNWSDGKQFFFFFSILLPPPPPADPFKEPEIDNPDLVEPIDEDSESSKVMSPEEISATFPEAFNKEAVAVVQARNSVVAAWLWRRYAANIPLAVRQIRVEPWPGMLGQTDL